MDQLTVATHNQKLELWIGRIKECRSSGMTVSDWCNINDVSNKSYYYWMRKIKREAFNSLPVESKNRTATTSVTSPFAEVQIPNIKPTSAIRVYLAQAVVDIPDGTTSATLTEVLNAVGRIC